jgi:MFS transporter, DHA3 family, macrolide efflux protein
VLLRNRPFASLWSAQLVSQSGDAIFNVALLWLVLVTTNSTLLVGFTQAVVVLPQVLVGPIAGVYADRLNRRDIMIVSNIVQGMVTAALSIMYIEGVLAFPYLILLVLLLYTAAQFMRASLNAILPRMIGRGNLGAANGLLSVTASANQLTGYALGGVIFATIGAAGSISYDSLTFFFAAAALTLVAKSYGQTGSGSPSPGQAHPEKFGKSFREGLTFVRQSRVFLELIVFGLIANFFSVGATAILAPYVRIQLHGGAPTYGFSLAFVALGGIIGSAVVGKLDFRAYVGKLLLIGVIVFGVLIALLGVVTWIPAAFAIFLSIGLILGMVNPPITVLMQTKVPNELLGRASTVGMSVLGASQPVAAVVFGWLAGTFSVGSLFLGAGTLMFVISLALYYPFAELRKASY